MAIKKSELYNKIWKMCDDLRGGMDPSQYKDYILTMLFVKYVSDKHDGKRDSVIQVPKGGSFQDMIALKGKPGIGHGINTIIKKLADANGLSNLFDEVDFDNEEKLGSGQDMVDTLSGIISIFEDERLDFSKNKAEGDDILGDVYEYLMRNFAIESGKSKGQFYTPAEVSRVIAKIIGISQAKRKDQTLYDPACGSGSLLLKAAHEAPHGITIYGQEKDVATRALAVMNMWLHDNPDAIIERENTITKPQFKDGKKLQEFDFVVSNPPFSLKSWSKGIIPEQDEFERFKDYGIPPKKNGDYAFLLHVIKSLKDTGKAAIILPHGVLFRGNVEADIRKKIIDNGYIKGIIGLPANLFYGTGIAACILLLDKENAKNSNGIFMIDASKGFIKDGNKNKLQARDIHRIVDVFNEKKEIYNFSRMVPISEIIDEKNAYNLNIPRYINSQENEDIQDIDAHLKGDMPESDIDDLNEYWKVLPSIKQILFTQSERQGYVRLKVNKSEIKTTVLSNNEFITHSTKIEKSFSEWRIKNTPLLKNIQQTTIASELINTISENLLETFTDLKLIDRYEMYQHLMKYWEDTMQDDVYLIMESGWKAEIKIKEKKKGKKLEWESELIPKSVVIDKYFTNQRDQIKALSDAIEDMAQQEQTMEEESMDEESMDEDLFSEVRGTKDKITKTLLSSRINSIKEDPDFSEELKALTKYQELFDQETELNGRLKELESDLNKKLLEKYKNLTENEIKMLIVEDKWLSSLEASIKKEIERISQKLAGRIKDLAERYETPLPLLVNDVQLLTKKVDEHLLKMGYKWQQN